MKDITNYLIHFIEDEFIKKDKKTWNIMNHGQGTPEYTQYFIKYFINNIKKGELEYKKQYEKIIKNELIVNKTNFPRSDDFTYIPDNIRKNIENKDKKGYYYKFSIHGKEIQIYLIKPLDNNEKNNNKSNGYYRRGGVADETETLNSGNKVGRVWEKYFENYLYKIYLWLYIAYSIKKSECSQYLDIYLYLSDSNKIIPNKKSYILNQGMVNTAFTRSCKKYNNINIFREEEWFKVFIHETFHSLDLDFSNSDYLTEISKKNILEFFSINSDVLLYETYCELNAEMINIIFFIYFSTKKNINKENYEINLKKNFEKYMKYEQIFSCFQCVKVLNHYKLRYQDIITINKKNNYKEETHIFVYYILKAIMITNYKDYLEWFYTKNNGSLDFIKTDYQINNFIGLIKKNYNTPLYLQKMERMENWFYNNNDKNIENITLRMSMIES